MLKNNKGLTIFEMLISISVGSVLITMLMSMLAGVLLTKNEIDYQNRLGMESYSMNNTLSTRFFDLGYRSIQIDEVHTDATHTIFILTEEYDIGLKNEIIGPKEGFETVVKVLWLNLSTGEDNGLYYGDYDDLWDPELATYVASNAYRIAPWDLFFHNTEEASSSMDFVCLGTDRNNQFDECARAYVIFDLYTSVRLANGNLLPPRRQFSTLFY